MKLLCIALFTIQLLCVDAFSEPVIETELPDVSSAYPISCNNPEVLAAVDLTLRKFNAEQKVGHQYALYRVTNAEAQGMLGRRYFVEFSIQETDCPVGTGKLWRECNYVAPDDASTGYCESNVYIHKTQGINEVSEHNCTIFSDHHSPIEPKTAPCLGCPMELPIDHPQLNETLNHAIVKFNAESNYTNYFQRDVAFNFTQQVVAGLKYKLKFTVKETECSKEDPNSIPNECDVKDNGIKLYCHSTVLKQLWLNYTEVHVHCDPRPFHLVPFMAIRYAGWGPFSNIVVPPIPTESGELHGESEELTPAQEQLAGDLAGPTCPGKPWKALQPTAAPPAEGTFSDSDLLKR